MPISNRMILSFVLLAAAGLQAGCGADAAPVSEELASQEHALTAVSAPEAGVKDAARTHLQNWLSMIPAGTEREYGFSSREEFATASVGEPYAMYSVGDDGALTPLNVWRVPVTVRGDFRALLDLEQSANGLTPISIGAAPLASELGRVEQAGGPSAKGAKRRSLVRSYKKTADFVAYGDNAPEAQRPDQVKLHPLESAEQSLGSRLPRRRANAAQGRAAVDSKATDLTLAEVKPLLTN